MVENELILDDNSAHDGAVRHSDTSPFFTLAAGGIGAGLVAVLLASVMLAFAARYHRKNSPSIEVFIFSVILQ